MTNHVHLVLVPEHEQSLEILLRRVHGRYSQMLNARRLRSGHLWQNRYFSCALSESHLRRTLAYVETNPVRAGLVEKAEQYQWSSAPVHVGCAPDRLQMTDPKVWSEYGGTEGWKALLADVPGPAQQRILRRCTYAGRPFGEEDFIAQMEQRFGRKWRRWTMDKLDSLNTKPAYPTAEHSEISEPIHLPNQRTSQSAPTLC